MYYNLKYLIANCVLIITFLVSTPVEDEAIQEEEHMDTFEITLLPFTTEAGKEHSTALFY